MGISETAQRAVVPRYMVSELRGTAYGLYNVVIGITFFAANLVFGFLWDNYGLDTAVYYSMSVTVTAICGMLIFIEDILILQPRGLRHNSNHMTGNDISPICIAISYRIDDTPRLTQNVTLFKSCFPFFSPCHPVSLSQLRCR
jgi:MFS family permease